MFGTMSLPAILLICLLFSSSITDGQTASVQFIHNSPDPTLSAVDVWLNDTLWADNIGFLQATPLLSLDTSSFSSFEVRNSLDSSISYWSWNASLPDNSKHIFILHGQLNTELYAPSIPLAIAHYSEALAVSASPASIDVLFFHGNTEIDTVDIAESQLFELTAFDQLPYGSFSSYLNMFAADYGWSILDAQDNHVIGDFALPVTELNWSGKAITIITGGFLNQIENNFGQALGMWATTSIGGPLVPLQPLQWTLSATVQFLHNSSLPASGNIRIETDGNTWESALDAHEATPQLPFPAGKDVIVSIHSNLLGSPIDSIWSDTIHLYGGGTYQLIWYGGSNAMNPAQLLAHAYQPVSTSPDNSVLMQLFNGSSSFETISLFADTLNTQLLFEDVQYGVMSDTLTIPSMNEEWILFSENDSLNTYQAPFDTLQLTQSRLTALSFDSLGTNVPEIWLSTELGGPMHRLSTITIPPSPVFCSVQLVHASADTILHSIEIRINDSIVSPLNFESASAFLNVQCNDPIRITIARQDNPSIVLHSDTIQLDSDQFHRLILWGILDTQNYNPAPELDWFIDTNISLTSSGQGNFDIQFFHAATDLGVVQINESSIPIVPFFIQTGIGEISNPQSLAAQNDYGIELLNAPTQFVYGTYGLPSNSWQWENEHVTLISTGFRQPDNNSHGEALQIWALQPDGSMQSLENFVQVSLLSTNKEVIVFPNPASQHIQVQMDGNFSGQALLHLIDCFGAVSWSGSATIREGKLDQLISLQSFPSGLYTLQIELSGAIFKTRICVIR